jgi:toxin ParE1/3/4
MPLIVSPLARNDLEEIGDFIAVDNRRRARTFVQELREACRGLVREPNRYPLDPELGAGVRRRAYASYLIFYLVRGEDTVVILRVVHSARDIRQLSF